MSLPLFTIENKSAEAYAASLHTPFLVSEKKPEIELIRSSKDRWHGILLSLKLTPPGKLLKVDMRKKSLSEVLSFENGLRRAIIDEGLDLTEYGFHHDLNSGYVFLTHQWDLLKGVA